VFGWAAHAYACSLTRATCMCPTHATSQAEGKQSPAAFLVSLAGRELLHQLRQAQRSMQLAKREGSASEEPGRGHIQATNHALGDTDTDTHGHIAFVTTIVTRRSELSNSTKSAKYSLPNNCIRRFGRCCVQKRIRSRCSMSWQVHRTNTPRR
jgi:hypothetical protein